VTVFYPDTVSSQGKDTWLYVPAIATRTAMTVAEATATGSVVIQNAMRPGFGSDAETERILDERQGSNLVYEVLGTTKATMPDATFIDRPQDATGAAARKHIETLTEGALGFLINRRGLGSATDNWVAPAAGQKYVGYPVQCGPQVPLAPGDTKAFEYKQGFAVTGAKFSGTIAA
jgi:hypothetical protein